MPLNESKVKHTYKRSRMRHEARMERKKKTSKSVILDGWLELILFCIDQAVGFWI